MYSLSMEGGEHMQIYKCKCCNLWMILKDGKNIKNRYLSAATFGTYEEAEEFASTYGN